MKGVWVSGALCVGLLGCGAETDMGRGDIAVAGFDGLGADAGAPAVSPGGGAPPVGAAGNPVVGGDPTGQGAPEGEYIEDNCNQDVDVVFVLDVSGSMIPPLTFVQDEVAAVDAALQTKNLPNPPHFGLVVFVDDVAVMNGGAPYADVGAFTAAVTNEINLTNVLATRQAVASEGNLSWPENSLDALHAAATRYQWRPAETTLRTIIHLTDASFWDGEKRSSEAGDPMGVEAPNAGGCTDSYLSFAGGGTCTMTSSVYSYDQTIQALRDNEIWVNTFAAKTGGPPGLGISPPSHGAFRGTAANVGIGFHEPYDGRNSIAESTNGLSWDIDEVFDGIISLADPINGSIEDRHCVEYLPPPPPPPII